LGNRGDQTIDGKKEEEKCPPPCGLRKKRKRCVAVKGEDMYVVLVGMGGGGEEKGDVHR